MGLIFSYFFENNSSEEQNSKDIAQCKHNLPSPHAPQGTAARTVLLYKGFEIQKGENAIKVNKYDKTSLQKTVVD